MKKTLIAVAALAATSAFAQVTISGSMQVGIVDSGAAGANAAVTHLGNGMNAINMAASEDLGGGLKAGWDAQMRYNAATGDRNSAGAGQSLFHNLNVYLSSATLGTARIGKIAEISNCAYDPWACGGGASLAAGIGLSNLVGAGAMANAVSYQTPTIAGFSAGAQKAMTPTDGTTGGRNNERSIANVSYANGPLTVQYLRTSGVNFTDASDAAAGATTVADSRQTQQSIAGSYDFGVAKLILLTSQTKNAAEVKTAEYRTIAGTVPLGGAYTLLAGYTKRPTTNGATTASNLDTKVAVGVNYALSKRTTLGADVFKAEQAALTGFTGNAGTGFALRMRHTF
ncbi:MAG: porin [Curvibacter sp.]